MLEHLRGAGMLKRVKEVEPEMLLELFRAFSSSLHCRDCNASGLVVVQDEEEQNEREWGAAPVCKKCAAPIPPERLEIFPDTDFCMQCQSSQERGENDEQREFCPYCGGLMSCRQTTRGGLSKYAMRCQDCRR